jgi:hypothetical protein
MLNFPILLGAALIPLVVGFVWYNPKVFGNMWMKTNNLTPKDLEGSNMIVIFGLTYVFSVLIAISLNFMVVHQMSLYAIVQGDPDLEVAGSELNLWIESFMAKYGNNFRTFKHGSLHGTIAALFFATPVIAINALFERKSTKYVLIHAGYWVVSLAIMGGIICQFA